LFVPSRVISEDKSMPTGTGSTFVCSACGKKFVWKPELAGKTVRCKCGQSIAVPTGAAPAVAAPAAARPAVKSQLAPQTAAVRKPPKPAASNEPSLDDLYDLAADADSAPASRSSAAMESAAVAAPVAVPGLEDDAYRCPSCNEPMQAGSILCGSCGFNLKTGEKMTVKRAGGTVARPAAGGGGGGSPSGSAFSGIPARSKPKFVEDKQGQMMKILIPVFLIAAVIGGIFAFKIIAGRSGNSAAALSTGKGDDPDVAEKMENENPMEVHAWFKQNPSRMMGELSERQAIGKADELEKMGAKKCYAFGSMMCLCMAVELPDDPAQRKALIDYRNKWNVERHYKPVKDEGQKYMILNFGL
ncbi:MAG TPA: hypothetical protein VLI90_05750, partial [Tepidisphaeraceae bacterium]|nr:hypothetical protein [Tepidisphaeraceae bacterium]